MRYGFFFGLITTLLVSQTFANDLEITEHIRGKMAATEATASANFKTRCEQWEQTLRADAGNAVLYASCGADSAGGFSTQYKTTECYTKVTENGQTYEECGDAWHSNPVYGYASYSEGKVLLSVSETIGLLTDQVGGDKFSCQAKDGKGCFASREKSFNSFEEKCSAFRAKAKTSFGARYIYASCGEPKNTANSNAVDQFQYVSKATIYYKK